ncbi:MAG TPA: type IV pilus biogenesis/stability protein PilW [Casimicrobiaceae bacterium]|jgi:type IV pilus assembly protein PilF|nr:type IV pilus biogenesis/stability protein PilW [Casimicrobiaceae bacterium]
MHFSFRHAVALIALALAACASKAPTNTPPAQPEQAPVKAQEATLPQRAQQHADLAAGYYERGQFDVALQELAEAQRLDPSNARVYNVYGLVYTMMGDNKKAEESFRQALSLAPNDSEIHHNWGVFLCATGRAREAIPEFDQAIRNPLYKTPETALINAGKCSVTLGDLAKANTYFRQAMAVSPNNPVAAYNLALLAYRENRLDEARGWMRPVMQQQTPPPEALYLGMCIERKQGDRQSELSYTTQLRNRYPDSAEAKALSGGSCE